MRGLSGPLARAWQWASPALVVFGTGSVLAGLVIIWAARLTVPYPVYVSELGAVGAPTAGPFAVALLCIAAGGITIALAADHARSDVRVLGSWLPAVTIGFAGLCFGVASQVTCTATCPVPFVDPRSTTQDLTHTVFAVLGFAAACYAMLQVAFSRRRPRVARFSLVCSIAVGAISGAGGVLALVHIAVDFGSWLEFAGMTVAIAWLATYGMALVLEGRDRVGTVLLDPELQERMNGEPTAWPRPSGLSESA
ncbi:DUF998 domain-containing protein [Diaminobutyricibacter sp. McL0618]|uniref:DUF998 domain-containing protein n=1 Tax=Leifsonia sp. McL0618 TaxID=3415677 RepID=UPI003CE84FDE